MRRRRLPGCAAALALVALFAAASSVAAAGEEESFRSTKISYVTSASIYIDAGSDEGMKIGQTVDLIRDGAVAATLKVTYLSSHRALCEKVSGEAVPAVGDSIRYLPAAPVAAPTTGATSSAAPATARAPSRESGVHGRIGVRYLFVRDTSGNGQDFSQPALDLRLDGSQMGGSPFDLSVDVRSRRTYATNSLGSTDTRDLTSVYRMALSFREPGSGWRATVGRQFSPSLASINIFDGALGEYRAQRWSAGAFTGSEPDAVNLGYSSQIQEHGAYVEWRNAPLAERRWSLTTGLIGSYDKGQINREFSYVQGSLTSRRLSLWLSEEVDLNRGWKKQAEGNSFTLTSTLFNLRYRVGAQRRLRQPPQRSPLSRPRHSPHAVRRSVPDRSVGRGVVPIPAPLHHRLRPAHERGRKPRRRQRVLTLPRRRSSDLPFPRRADAEHALHERFGRGMAALSHLRRSRRRAVALRALGRRAGRNRGRHRGDGDEADLVRFRCRRRDRPPPVCRPFDRAQPGYARRERPGVHDHRVPVVMAGDGRGPHRLPSFGNKMIAQPVTFPPEEP
jgi:hypothetical protein